MQHKFFFVYSQNIGLPLASKFLTGQDFMMKDPWMLCCDEPKNHKKLEQRESWL